MDASLRGASPILVKGRLTICELLDDTVDHHIAGPGIEGQNVVEAGSSRNECHVGNASNVLNGTALRWIDEENVIHIRAQRRTVPTCRNVARAQIADHRCSSSFGDNRRFTDLYVGPSSVWTGRAMKDGRTLHGDAGYIRRGVTTTPDDLEGGVGQQLSEVPMEEGELLGTELIWWEEAKEPLSKIIWIGADSMREHADAPILAVSVSLYHRSADAVTRCTTHETDEDACR